MTPESSISTPEQTSSSEHQEAAKDLQTFTEVRANLEHQQLILDERLVQVKDRAIKSKALYKERRGEEAPPGMFDSSVAVAERAKSLIEGQKEFLRPSSPEDRAYRIRVMDELPKAIREAVPDGLPLRFHGTSIYIARDALSAGGLSSAVDRIGAASSYDTSDQVSVTTPDTVETTIVSYSGLQENKFCVPPGCIFVMLPASAEEAAAGTSMLMHNVDFKEHPEQLVGVMTAAENVPAAREWATEAGIDADKVCEFFEFADRMSSLKTSIENGDTTVQNHLPYPLEGAKSSE